MTTPNPLLTEQERRYLLSKQMLDHLTLANELAGQIITPIDKARILDPHFTQLLDYSRRYSAELEKEAMASPPRLLVGGRE